jgi:predicted ester cyclase
MPAEENKAIVHRIKEAVANGNLDALDELYAADLVDHTPFPEQAPALEGLKQKVSALNAALPDIEVSLDFLVAEGDKVVDHWTASATHQGEFMGIPPTGNQVIVTGISVYRLRTEWSPRSGRSSTGLGCWPRWERCPSRDHV